MGNQHVQVPNQTTENTTSVKGTIDKKFYTDLVVYVCLKKYMVAESGISLVSLRKISDESTISLGGVQSAIKRLEESNDIEKIKMVGRNQNGYKFNKTSEKFQMFDKEFIDNKNLTPQQKAFMITIQKHLFIDRESGIGKTTFSSKELSEKTGLSERVINERRKELELSGFISRRLTTNKFGNNCEALEFNLPKFGQYILCKFNEIDTNIKDQQSEITDLKMEINKIKSVLRLVSPSTTVEDITEL